MKLRASAIAFCVLLGSTSMQSMTTFAAEQQESVSMMESNKKIVVEFFEAALNQKNAELATSYLGDKYVQHNPMAMDGAEGLQGFIGFMKTSFPDARIDIKRVFADGDHVILHSHAVMVPGTAGAAVIDIFRLENGKIVEHWDVMQDVPAEAANSNGMF